MADLTTAFTTHNVTMRNAAAIKTDLTTLVVADLVTMRNGAAANTQNDLNTAVADYIRVNG